MIMIMHMQLHCFELYKTRRHANAAFEHNHCDVIRH